VNVELERQITREGKFLSIVKINSAIKNQWMFSLTIQPIHLYYAENKLNMQEYICYALGKHLQPNYAPHKICECKIR
jgi:hypothetical protein